MSAKSMASFAGLSKFRDRLAAAVAGLKEAASGEVVARAAEKVATQIRKVVAKQLSAHQMSGAAMGNTVVDVSGGLMQLHGMPACLGEEWSRKSYLSTKEWWPFRSGYMPPFVISNAAKIFEAELVAALGGHRSPLLVAEEEAEAAAGKRRAREEARVERSRAKFKRDNARIYRRSDEYRAKKKAERSTPEAVRNRAVQRGFRKLKSGGT